MIAIGRFKYFACNILLTLFGIYVSLASSGIGSYNSPRYDGWIILGVIFWLGGIIYTAVARLKDMGYEGYWLLLSVLLIPFVGINYFVGVMYLSLRNSR